MERIFSKNSCRLCLKSHGYYPFGDLDNVMLKTGITPKSALKSLNLDLETTDDAMMVENQPTKICFDCFTKLDSTFVLIKMVMDSNDIIESARASEKPQNVEKPASVHREEATIKTEPIEPMMVENSASVHREEATIKTEPLQPLIIKKPFQCTICEKRFKKEKNLNAHVEELHKMEVK